MDCEICNRVNNPNPDAIVYEDDNVVAYLRPKQITLGKTSVYYKKHINTFTGLSEEERASFMKSVLKVAKILEKALKPDHMNYCLLGNYHKHLHWHLIPRYYDGSKDKFYFKTGLEPCHMGREIEGRYDISEEEVKILVEKIKNANKE